MTTPPQYPQNPDPYGYQGQSGQPPAAQPYGQPTYGQPQFGGQPGYGQPGAYGMPQYPGGPGINTPVTSTPRPTTVLAAMIIYLVMAAVYVASFVMAVNSDAFNLLVQQAALNDARLNGVSQENILQTTKYVAIGAGVVIAGLVVLFTLKMAAGRNWARIVLTVLSAFAIISGLSQSVSTEITLNGTIYEVKTSPALTYAAAALALIALIAMWLPPSNSFFTARKAEKMRRDLSRL